MCNQIKLKLALSVSKIDYRKFMSADRVTLW